MRQSGGGRFIRNSFRAKRPNGYDAEKAIAPAGQSSAASHASSASMGTGWRRRRAQCASRSMVKRAGRRSAHIPQETQTVLSMDRVIMSSTWKMGLPPSAHCVRHFPRKRGKLLCRYPKPSRYHGEGGPRERWKGHKTGAVIRSLSLRQQPLVCIDFQRITDQRFLRFSRWRPMPRASCACRRGYRRRAPSS